MPIIGLTDRGLSFPEIGQVRKGAPKGENMPGKDLDHFRVTFAAEETEAARVFVEKYGTAPKELNIILPFNEIPRMWDAWLEAYTAGRLVARADGEKFIFKVDTRTGELVVRNGLNVKTMQPETYTEGQIVGNDYQGKPIYCKPVGRLRVIIPELARAAYLTVMTTSIHDIGNISAQLEAFARINGGRIAGIPLVLRRRPKSISVPKGNQRVRMSKWMLSIEADPAWVKAKLMEVKNLALPGNGLALLPDKEHEVIDTTATDVTEETEDDLPSDPEIDVPPPGEPETQASEFNALQFLVDKGIAATPKEAQAIANYYAATRRAVAPDELLKWGKLYRGWVDMGTAPSKAAENATAGAVP